MAQQMHGVVKAVLSGDSLIIRGTDLSKGPPPEKLLSLAGISAPRLGNRNGAPDQPFAWASREFLRQTCIGSQVAFTVDATAPQPGATNNGPPREFGRVYLDNESLANIILAAGWARVKSNATELADFEDLSKVQRAAEEAGRGVFGSEGSSAIRQVRWAGTFDPGELLKQLQGGPPQDAIVEQIPSGSVMRVMLLPGFEQVTIILSGIQCPAIRRNEDGTEEAAPFSREARFFVESRLLHRDVKVKLEGLDKNGTIFGTVLHPQGNMSLELVKAGLAKVVDYSSSLCDNAPALRAAERTAKERRQRMWKEYVPPNSGMGEFQGKVVEVVSGDTIIVLDPSNKECRYSLSSIRCPVMGKEPKPWAAEAKECLRRAVIGKKCKVVPEYKRTFAKDNGPGEERAFCSLIFNGDKNAAQMLVSEGLAAVNSYGESTSSPYYESLVEAEAAATAAKKAMHSNTPPPRANAVIDLTLPTARQRAASHLGTLQRQGKVRAVVQFVVNGARFKLTVPKDNLLISFVCVGLRCRACARRDGSGTEGEPFGDEALLFTRSHCFQRDVEIEVESVDKAGNFLGSLFLPDKRNLGVLVLEAGLAERMGAAADRSTYGDELYKAEEAAKSANRKIWENYSEAQEAERKAEAEAVAAAEQEPIPDSQKQMVQLTLTEIIDGARFYAHVASDKSIDVLQQQLAATCVGNAPPFEPRAGQVVAAKFSQDDMWYRAKVLKKERTSVTVFFIDYGNTDLCTADRLRPLDPTLGPATISAQAIDCRLACLIVGQSDDGGDGQEAAMSLAAAAWNKAVLARVEDRQGEILHVTLFDAAQQSVNEQLISAGLARVEKTVPKRNMLLAAGLREKEEAAKASRQGMWRYGDIEEDESPEFGFRKPAPPASAWGKK
eukprot:CAMPEP_0119344144 /NCGR_PEP_ID=MMETSP1333-20130426/106819_1 /TAXON_ID=418940 /ORGANISM="Scyphosphaera apsteinii, Strain RCC1455" /LENGTH=892 /DNA_ID=CAMNT_0007356571 /DNA_START=39 /DNA_END=2717 /DNA_ORIENTATION=-